jgi:hypothetical protein
MWFAFFIFTGYLKQVLWEEVIKKQKKEKSSKDLLVNQGSQDLQLLKEQVQKRQQQRRLKSNDCFYRMSH